MNILLTGKPGIGKTTAIKRIISLMGKERVGGFWTSELREKGRRVGFVIQTTSGESRMLAHVNFKAGPSVGKYGVDVNAIDEVAIPAMQSAREGGKYIIIDEIASMELKSQQFAIEVRSCLDTGKVIGTLQQRSGEFHDEIRNRPDTLLIEITMENRDKVPARVARILKDSIEF